MPIRRTVRRTSCHVRCLSRETVDAVGSSGTVWNVEQMQKLLKNRTAVVIVLVALVGVLCAGVAVVLSQGGSSYDADPREQARGVTETVTVTAPARNASGAIPAQPRPGELPPLVASAGDCKVQLNKLRDLMEEVPSGLLPRTPAQDALFNQQMSLITGTVATPGACSPETVAMFREQEVGPWLTWAPPSPTPTPAPTDAPK